MLQNVHIAIAEAVPESVRRLRDEAARAAIAAGAVNGTVDQVRLAVSEAATNAILHAYPDGVPGEVRLQVELEQDALVVTVCDDGTGMRVRHDSPGAGLGMPLITGVTSRWAVSPGDEGGTAVRMWFALPNRTD